MSKKVPSQPRVIYALKEIEKEVLRVLGKHQDNVLTITDLETFHDYVSKYYNILPVKTHSYSIFPSNFMSIFPVC